MPYGLAIGTVTYRSRLHISLRYRHPLFSGDAARSFAGTYVEALKAVSAAAPGCADAIKRRQGAMPGWSRRHGCAVSVGEDAFRSGCRRQNSPRMKLNDGHGLTERISRRIPSDPRDPNRRPSDIEAKPAVTPAFHRSKALRKVGVGEMEACLVR